jgi:hypothetical protein
MQQKYYRVDYGHFKLPALPGWKSMSKKLKNHPKTSKTSFFRNENRMKM